MKGKATSLAESFNGVGSLFGPTIGGLLYDLGGFALPFGASGGFSLILALICVFCLTDVTDLLEEETEADRDVSWRDVLLSPGLSVSVFSLISASVAWQWYSPSLEPFLLETFSLSASDTGLVFTAFGVTYTVVSPLAGLLTDQVRPLLSAVGSLLHCAGPRLPRHDGHREHLDTPRLHLPRTDPGI